MRRQHSATKTRDPEHISSKQIHRRRATWLKRSSGSEVETVPSKIAIHDERAFSQIKLGSGNLQFDVMVYRGQLAERQPLVILNSLEILIPPSRVFCERMWSAGYQVIFVRRPGFGATTPLPRTLQSAEAIKQGALLVTEAALLAKLIDTMELKDVAVMGLGSANPSLYRLAFMQRDIALSIFMNPAFNQDIYDNFNTDWLSPMLRQVVNSPAGLQVATSGLKTAMRMRPVWLFNQIVQNSRTDLDYVKNNQRDFFEAGHLLQRLEKEVLLNEITHSLEPDTFLKNQCFAVLNTVVLSGRETPDFWQTGLEKEADRVGAPVVFSDKGNFFVPFVDPDLLIEILQSQI